MNSFSDCESSSSAGNIKIKRKGRSNSLKERLSRALTPTRSKSFRITTRVRNSIDSGANSENDNEFSWQTILLSSRANNHHGQDRAPSLKKCNVAASAGGTVWYADVRYLSYLYSIHTSIICLSQKIQISYSIRG